MPLIEINADPATLGTRTRADVLRAVNTAVAAALEAAPDAAWSIWRDVDATGYVIGGDDATRYEAALPPAVHVYARRTAEEWELIAEAIETVLEELLELGGAAILVTTQPFRG